MYYALQYISLSDAVTLTFLTPTVAAIAGYFLLGEGFSRSQAMAGCKFPSSVPIREVMSRARDQ